MNCWPTVDELNQFCYDSIKQAREAIASLPPTDPDNNVFYCMSYGGREWFVRAANVNRAELIAAAWLGIPERVFWELRDDVNEADIELFHFAQQETCERTDPDPTCARIVDLLGSSIFIDRAYRPGYNRCVPSQDEKEELEKLRAKVAKKLAKQQAADADLFTRFPKVSDRAAVRQMVAKANPIDLRCLIAASDDALQRLGMDYACRSYYLRRYIRERLDQLKSGSFAVQPKKAAATKLPDTNEELTRYLESWTDAERDRVLRERLRELQAVDAKTAAKKPAKRKKAAAV